LLNHLKPLSKQRTDAAGGCLENGACNQVKLTGLRVGGWRRLMLGF
jgi:hypothetical protein